MPFLNPVLLNEKSLRITLLHQVLDKVGFPVSAAEVNAHQAGDNTRAQVRAFQAKFHVVFDAGYVVDEITYEALKEELNKSGYLAKSNVFTVKGTVYNGKEQVVKLQDLIALDVDLRGAAIYRTVQTISEIEKNGGFEFLGEKKSTLTGAYYIEFFSFQFGGKERKKADIIVYAVDTNGKILGRSRLVNAEEYSDLGEVRNLDVLISSGEEGTEYDVLMNKLQPFLNESTVRLAELSQSNDQVKFTAGELDEPESKIQIAVDAELLKNYKASPDLSHELLYGIGRQNIALNWLSLYSKTDIQLKTAINTSVREKIISLYKDNIIATFLQLLHSWASEFTLQFKGVNQAASLNKILAAALPLKNQRDAFVNAYRNFKNQTLVNERIDYKKFWSEYLPKLTEFSGKPELIEGLLLTQQLSIISGNHQPLMEQLQSTLKITSVTQLIELEDNKWKDLIVKSGVPDFITGDSEAERIRVYTNHLQTFLNTAYPTQKIASMVKKNELPLQDVNISNGINTFLTGNLNFEFGSSLVSDFDHAIKVAAPVHFENVKTALKSLQRIFQVSPTPEVMGVLLKNNLNSANTIASYPKKSFIKLYGKELGGDKMAEAVYQRSQHNHVKNSERAMKLHDVIGSGAPGFAYDRSDRAAVISVLENKLPNYASLFGSPDICECEQCRSMYSASAYFVDLLRFLWRGVRNNDVTLPGFPGGKSPLDIFTLRRPDLLHLPLTCENTNTLIPYIDLVNEVMEYYTYHDLLDSGAAYDTGSTTSYELRANPQNFVPESYRILNTAVYPFSLPYHQPLDTIRTYGDHLKMERYELMKAMQNDFSSAAIKKAIESETLHISPEEYRVLTLKDFADFDDVDELSAFPKPVRQLQQYFGFPFAAPDVTGGSSTATANMEKVAGYGVADGIHEFLRRTGIHYTDLVELITSKFINPHQDILDFLEDLFANSTINAVTIYSGMFQINRGTPTDADAVKVFAALSGKMEAAAFSVWVRQNFVHFNSVITLYEANSACNLNTTCLKIIENIYTGISASGITNNTWSKIHRFIRLWRKLGWTIHEVDIMLAALGESDITGTTISKLSYVALLNKELKLPVNKLATLWGSIDTIGSKSLYSTLFLNKAVQRMDAAFDADLFGNYLSGQFFVYTDKNLSIVFPALLAGRYQYNPVSGKLNSSGEMTIEDRISLESLPGITGNFKNAVVTLFILSKNLLINHVPAILAAFRMSEADLNAILEVSPVKELNIHNLSLIYRYTLLSKALQLKVADCCLLAKLFNSTTSPVTPSAVSSAELIFIHPSATLDFYEQAILIKKAGFKAEVLQYIFQGTLPAESTLGLNVEKAKQTVSNLNKVFAAIELNYPTLSATLLSADIVKNNLSLSFNADVVNQMMGIIGTRQTFSVFTDSSLPVIISPALALKYSYDLSTGKLLSQGMMSDTEHEALKSLAGASENFRKAVDELYLETKTLRATSPVYSVSTDRNLDVIIPDSLSPKFTYTKASGILASIGILSDSEKISLKEITGSSDNFLSAVDLIFKMPEDVIRNNFSGVFSAANNARSNADLIVLLNHPAQPIEQTPAEKLLFVYDSYLPLLKQKLRENAILQEIAGLIGLSEETTAVLLRNDLHSLIDSLPRRGFSAEYFSDSNLKTPVLQRIDNEINFDYGTASPGTLIPADNFSVRWQCYLSAPSSDEYILIVDVKEADESFRLYLDSVLLLEKAPGNLQTSWEVIATLNASQMAHLSLEYMELSNRAGIRLSWKKSTSVIETISSSSTFSTIDIDNFISTVRVYHCAASFISRFALTGKEVNHFINFKTDFDNINFKAITPIHWQRINNYVQLRNLLPQSKSLLMDVFVEANKPSSLVDMLTDLLHLASGWHLNTLKYLINYFGLSANDFRNEYAFSKIYIVLSFVSKTGLSVQTLAQWAKPETQFDHLNATADLVKSTVKAKYEVEDWLEIAGNLNNKIRENQKQALISYLLTKQQLIDWGVKDADGLFEYFLIDVQMGVCMDTSRIVQGNAAVQMFVNRCLLNLESDKQELIEKGVSPDAIDKERWEWMQHYRVWEANRKIFLYPENWLEPEWRDDRSPFFKELESELTQTDITDRNVETAFRNYLTKLDTVANLNICGMYQENYENGALKLLHVFGCSHNAPYLFFYRTCNEFYKWSVWEKVQVDIRVTEAGENSGVHLVPVVWKKRLFIFWPEFLEKQEEVLLRDKEGNHLTLEQRAQLPPSNLAPRKYWEIRLGWSEFIDKKWSSKQLAKEFIRINANSLTDPIRNIILKSSILEDGLYIYPYAADKDLRKWENLNYFKLSDVQSQVLTLENNLLRKFEYESSRRYETHFEKHVLNGNLQFWGNNYLRQDNINHSIIFSNDVLEKELAPDAPFFYQALNRTYFIRTSLFKVFDQVRNPEFHFIPFFAFSETSSVHYNIAAGNADLAIPVSGLDITGMGAAFSGMVESNYHVNIPEFYLTTGFEFNSFHHPLSGEFISNLNRGGIKGLMDSDTLLNTSNQLYYNDSGTHFENDYLPEFPDFVIKAPVSNDYKAGEKYTYYKENICFDVFGANSIYNWELFFYAPLYVATRLSKNGKFREAMKWFHFIFDPTTDEMPLAGQSNTSRYWKTLPFKTTPAQSLEEWFTSIGPNANTSASAENPIVAEWRNNPFKPFVVARNRPLAFMKNVVIKYVENLREWGDSLFRMFTRESVNEALQLYVIANHILGPRPELLPKRGTVKAQTYDSLKNKFDDLSNALVELENIFPYSSSVTVSTESDSPGLLGIGPSLYFCIPYNEKLMEHWDTIGDRLFKIRHCMDIDGVERQLALFSPPIDPAMLINAAAQGINLGSILSDLSSPPPVYRFNYLMQKANEFCGEVKSLGSLLLSAIEKKDSEELGRLRGSHETSMLSLMTGIRERQVLDAGVNKEGLLKSRQTAAFRFAYYRALLSDEAIAIPAPPSLDSELNSDSQLPGDTVIPVIKPDVDESLVDSEEAGVKLIRREKQQIDDSMNALISQSVATAMEGLAGILNLLPNATADGKPFGIGVGAGFGGSNFGAATSALAKVPQIVASVYSHNASQSAQMAGYIRREQEWTLQANLAAKEIIQLDKQITSADIKHQIAQKELTNHLQQIENSKRVEQFLKDKFTNLELYQWMKEQLFAVYKQSYNMAYDLAKKVEKSYRYELGNEATGFIQYGYWDNSLQGLCAGEKLQLALRQLEKSYIENNKRELELSKSVSMALLNPIALQELRTMGKCFLTIPEELYDLDYQGHYFRRIKSVSVSLPCIAGPFTTVNCTLRLLKNTVRINSSPGDGNYEHNHDQGFWIDDDRFMESNVPVKSIATSTGQRDTGMFELSFRDERYLPFEGAGAISQWKIELTGDVDLRQFDYATIADVILHINYTAREDAGTFKDSTVDYIKRFFTNVALLSTQPLMRMFSMKHEFSTEWHKFLHPSVAGNDQKLIMTLRKEHFPFFTKDKNINVKKVEVLIKASRTGDYYMILTANDSIIISPEIPMHESVTYANMQKGTFTNSIPNIDIFEAITLKFRHHSIGETNPQRYSQIQVNPEEISDMFIVIHYNLNDSP